MTVPIFEPVFSTPIIIGVGAVATALAVRQTFVGPLLKSVWIKTLALLLRLVVIALMALFLLNPSEPIRAKTKENRSLVLVDESASMSLGAPSRWDEAGKWVTQFQAAMADARLEPAEVAAFASEVEPVRQLADRQPNGRETKLAAALQRVISGAGANPPDHIVVVSDGRAQDRSALPAALALAQARGVGISTLAVGTDTPPRNAGIAEVSAPRVVRANTRVSVQVELSVSGYAPGEPLSLTLSDENGVRLDGAELQAPPPGAGPPRCLMSFDCGVRTGKYVLELARDAGDLVTEDNHFEFTVEVSTAKLRVLMVEGTHVKRSVGTNGYFWNDIELMTRAWEATGEIEYDVLTPVSEYLNAPNLVGVSFANGEMIPDKTKTFPNTREGVYRYDVIYLSDVPVGNFSKQQMDWVVDWVVERGGGFIMSGGYTTFDAGHYDQTVWEHITPVDMLAFGDGFNEQRFKIEIPKSVRKHPTWRISPDPIKNDEILDTHPDFTGMNRIRRAKPGALVLMTRPDLQEPVIAVQQYGRGRSMAYLGDPNGGWAKYLVSWGPPGGPVQGPHTELGHGSNFHFNVAAMHAASGPPPPHPAPYYGQYFVNVVNWLGENSVRWRRDKLAGRVTTAQAQAGRDLPVAAEVLAVTKLDDLLALNVGARLDAPGSPRVRLEFDRDRREFLGHLPVPAEWSGSDLNVLFDTVAAGDSLTDSVRVGVLRANQEFAESAPDRPFLAELARIGGGRVIGSVADAVDACRDSANTREREERRSWRQPLWTHWPWWTALAAALCCEWALRRRAATHATLATALILVALPCVNVRAEDTNSPTTPPKPAASASEISALVEQLGAPRVRLRDEAEAKLEDLPEAFDSVKAAAKKSPNAELRLRARNVLQILRKNLWQEENVGDAHQSGSYAGKILASQDGKFLYSRGEDAIRVWDSATLKSDRFLGAKCNPVWRDWQRDGPAGAFALSPDGQRIACTDAMGTVTIYKVADGSKITSFTNDDPSDSQVSVNFRAVWGAAFFPDGRLLATTDRFGFLRFWNSATGQLVKSTIIIRGHVGRALAISPNGNLVACSTDLGGQPDHLFIWNVSRQVWIDQQETLHRSFSLHFSRDGSLLLAGNHGGFAILYKISPDGNLSDERRIGPMGENLWCTAFSADEKTIFATTEDPEGQLSEWDIETNEELWRSPPLGTKQTWVTVLGPDRVVTMGRDQSVRLWARRFQPAAK